MAAQNNTSNSNPSIVNLTNNHTQLEYDQNADRPENYFKIPPQTPKKLNVDALLATLTRTRAIVTLLETDGDSGKGDKFKTNHRVVMDTLWCVNGLLDQAEQIVKYAEFPYSPN